MCIRVVAFLLTRYREKGNRYKREMNGEDAIRIFIERTKSRLLGTDTTTCHDGFWFVAVRQLALSAGNVAGSFWLKNATWAKPERLQRICMSAKFFGQRTGRDRVERGCVGIPDRRYHKIAALGTFDGFFKASDSALALLDPLASS